MNARRLALVSLVLSVGLFGCGKKDSAAADAPPSTPGAAAPGHPDEKTPPAGVKTAAPGAGQAAPDVPSGTTAPPTTEEWGAAAAVNTVGAGAAAKDCTMKMHHEWLKVNCTGKIKEVTNMEGFGKKGVDYFDLVTPGHVADLVVRVKKGGSIKARILRDGVAGASLFVNWPGALDKPSIVALQTYTPS